MKYSFCAVVNATAPTDKCVSTKYLSSGLLSGQFGLLGAGAGTPVLNEGFNYPFHQPSRQGQGTAATFISQSHRVALASGTCTEVRSGLLLAAASPLSPLKRRLNFSFQLP